MDDIVTIIIAAYKRPKTLKLTLESIYKQQYPNWKVLIIADCCEEEYINQFKNCHPNVKVYNLSQRCGNQYGPNSVGIYLADSKYITFLNHDDILLSDHLSISLETLRTQNANFYLGTGAYCHLQNQSNFIEQEKRLLFSERNKSYAIWRCINNKNNNYFEPSSSVVIETKLAKKAGYWKSPSQSNLTPLLDWLSQIMLCKPIVCFSDQITTLKFNLHHTKAAGGDYSNDNYLEYVPYYIYENPDSARELIERDIALAKGRGLLVRPALTNQTDVKEESRNIFEFINFLHGKSITSSTNIGTMSQFFLKVIENRTGEKIKEFKLVEEVIKEFIRIYEHQ